MKERDDVCIKTYWSKEAFADVSEWAAKAGIRPRGLQLYVQKDSYSKEMIPNTKRIPKFLKFLLKYYKEHEAERMAKAADLIAKEKAIKEEKEKLGII